MEKIQLGDTVQCKITGFKGVAVARTEFINGCIQYQLAPKVGKDNKLTEFEPSIDEKSLKVVKKKANKKKHSRNTGGATKPSQKMRGY